MQADLWAPWRMAYIRNLEAQAATVRTAMGSGGPTSPSADTGGETNFLAACWANPALDREQGVIHRDALGMILLNRYPYANGHLLVALGEPRPTLAEYAPEHRAHFWKLMDLAMALCENACHPQGMNVGLNIGRAAGAGLPQHVHGHVVPRWAGDCNFLSVLGQVRVVPDALERTWERYRAVLDQVQTHTL